MLGRLGGKNGRGYGLQVNGEAVQHGIYRRLYPGDRVRFAPIDHAEFIRLGGDDSPLETPL